MKLCKKKKKFPKYSTKIVLIDKIFFNLLRFRGSQFTEYLTEIILGHGGP